MNILSVVLKLTIGLGFGRYTLNQLEKDVSIKDKVATGITYLIIVGVLIVI